MLLSARMMLCVLLAQWSGCYIQLDIHPKSIHLDSLRPVTIRCSLDLARSKTEKVYSIMLKQGGNTVAVLFQDGIRQMTDRHYDVTGSVTSKSVPFFQILLDNVTCLDRGNYTCVMAVKPVDKATREENVTSHLEIQGKSSDISVSVTPDTSIYTEGEVVHITCYRLGTSQTAYWSWTLPDGHVYTELNNCTYNESECIYMCFSSTQYTVTMHDSYIRCQSGGLVKIIRLNLPSTSQGNGLSMNTTTTNNVPPTHITASTGDASPQERDGSGMLVVYVLVSAFAVVLIGTLLCLVSDEKCKCHHRTSKNSMASRDTCRSERHRRRRRVIIVQSRDIPCPHPGMDRPNVETGYRDGYLHPQDGYPHPHDGYSHPQDGHPHPQDGHRHPQDGYLPQNGYLPQDNADSIPTETNENVYEEID